MYKCDTCNETFKNQLALYGHQRKHSEKVIKQTLETKSKKSKNYKVKTNFDNIFLNNKYTKWYKNIVSISSKYNPEGYYERHHIIPKCLNGTDKKENIIKFSARKHFICHWLLTKMVKKDSPEYYSLYKAFILMSGQTKNQERYIIPSILFEKLRKEVSRINSIQQSGENNSNYGKVWISNFQLKETKMIYSNEIQNYIRTGWVKGYTLKWENYDINGKKIPLIRIINSKTKQIKQIYPYQVNEYLSNGWMRPCKKINLKKHSEKILKEKIINHKEIIDINDFLKILHNKEIYEGFLKGESSRKIKEKVPLSHVSISRRLNIIKKIIGSYGRTQTYKIFRSTG